MAHEHGGDGSAADQPIPWDEQASMHAGQLAPVPMVALDMVGTIVWSNERADSLFAGEGSTLIGADAFELIHPEDLEQAVEATAANVAAFQAGTRNTVLVAAPYRIRTADGTYEWFEAMGALHPDLAGGQANLISLHHTGRHQRVVRAIELVAEGAGLGEVAEQLLASASYRRPRRVAGVSWIEHDERAVAGPELPAELVWTDDVDDPWCRSVAIGEVVAASIDDLRPGLRAIAEAEGLAACVAVPVADPSGREPACLVVWADHAVVVGSLQVRARRLASSLLTLALAARHEREQLEFAATRDALTGLCNRRVLLRRLDDLQRRGVAVALLFCDLDGFKPINDHHGHDVGDQVLRAVAGRLAGAVRSEDLVCRIGGDELAVIVPEAVEPTVVGELAERLVRAVAAPIACRGDGDRLQVGLTVSIGAAVPDPARPLDADTLLSASDDAMYEAKNAGGNGWRLRTVSR